MRTFIFFCFFLLIATIVNAQHHKYVAPSDPLVQQNISKQDLKFGLFMHNLDGGGIQ